MTSDIAPSNERWTDDAGRREFLNEPRTNEVHRRAFLAAAWRGAAGIAAAAGLAACGGSASPRPSRKLKAVSAGERRGHVQRFRSRPDLKPPVVVMKTRPSSATGEVILTDCHAGPAQQGPLILDSTGRLVWFAPVSATPTPASRVMNLEVQSYRGRPVLTWWHGAVVAAHGEGHYELLDQRYRRIAEVHGGNGYKGDLHEFVLTDAGTALFTCYGEAVAQLPRPSGSRRGKYLYGVVQEVDVATGAVLFQWRTDEHVGFIDSYHPAPNDPTIPWDYFHVNSIAIDPSDGHLLVSGRNTWAFYKVHRQTGAVIWTLGGKRSDFDIGRGARFAFQHHVRPHDGGLITMFDNEAGPPREAKQSRGLVLAVDEQARTVKFVKQFKHRPPILSPALGSVQDLGESGGEGTFMGWGDSSCFTHYAGSGAVRLDGYLTGSAISYRAFMQAWAGVPDSDPALAVERSATGAQLYVSWNGATEQRTWRVLGGARRQGLHELGTAEVADFETRITVAHAPAWLAVEALDGAERVLGRSAAVRE